MKNRKRTITDFELDELLARSPILPDDSFVDRTLLKTLPVLDKEVDALLSAGLRHISPDFTERTLERIHAGGRAMIFEFPAVRWLIQSGMVAAVVLIGLFSYSVFQRQKPVAMTTEIAKADISGMAYEELLYLEETLSSAKVLIELEKTLPLYFLLDEVDS